MDDVKDNNQAQQSPGEGKYFHVENIAKNFWTTLIGIILMTVSAGTVLLSQFISLPQMKLWVMGVVFIAGFGLLFMRDKLSTYIDIFTRKKIGPMLLLLGLPFLGMSQTTETQINTDINMVKISVLAPDKIATALQDLANSKVSSLAYPTTGTNTYTITINPKIVSYVPGLTIPVFFNIANTGAATLNVNSIGAKSLVKNVSTALSSGDLPIGLAWCYYDGTNFRVSLNAGGGIANSAGTNEIPKFNGTSFVPTGIFNPSSGNYNFGTGLGLSSININADGTGTDVGFNLLPKGAGTVTIGSNSGGAFIRGPIQIANYTTNGLVKTVGGAGTLSIATAGTDYQAPITFGTGVQTALGINVGSAGSLQTQIVYNVKNYGAVGDGTTDDTSAIIATIAAMPIYGGILYFPAQSGNGYLVSSTISITKNIIIVGDGMQPFKAFPALNGPSLTPLRGASTILFSSNNTALFSFSKDVTNNQYPIWQIRDISIVNIAGSTPVLGSAGITMTDNSNNWIVDRVNITGFYDNVLITSGCNYIIQNCRLVSPIHAGIYINQTVANDFGSGIIQGNSFYANLSTTSTAKGLWIKSGGGILVNANIFNTLDYNPPTTDTYSFPYCIYFDPTLSATSEFTISNNHFDNFQISAIYGHVTNSGRIIITGAHMNTHQTAGTTLGPLIDLDNWLDVAISNWHATSNGSVTTPVLSVTNSSNVNIGTGSSATVFSTNIFTGSTTNLVDLSNMGKLGSTVNIGLSNNKSVAGAYGNYISNGNNGTASSVGMYVGVDPTTPSGVSGSIAMLGTGFTTSGNLKAKTFVVEASASSNMLVSNFANDNLIFATNSRAARLNIAGGGSISTGSTLSAVFRTTNGGSDITANFLADPASSLTAGLAYGFETANGFVFTQGNGTRRILGASIVPSGLTSTAGSEVMGLDFKTQSGGTAASTKMTLTGAGALSLANGNFTLSTAGNKIFITEGSNGSVGQTTLVSGTKAITVTGTTTASRCIVTLVSQGGTVTTTVNYGCVCTSNTVTITALTSAAATNTTDTSIINYWIVN